MNSPTKIVIFSALPSSFPANTLPEQSVLLNRYDGGGMPTGRNLFEMDTMNIHAFMNNNKKLKHNKNLSHSIQFNSRRPFMPWHRVYSNANGNERLEKKVLVSNY